MATKDEVINLYRQKPAFTANDIAAQLGCAPGYVCATLQRNHLRARPGGKPPVKISPEEMGEKSRDQRDIDILCDLQDGHSQADCAEYWGVSKSHVQKLAAERART